MKINLLLILFFLCIQSLALSKIDLPDSIINKISLFNAEDKVNYLADECWRLREKNPQLSINLGIQALNLAEEFQFKERNAEINNYIGAIYINYTHDIINSIPFLQKAREISILTNDSIQLAYSYNNLGDIYFTTNNLALAIDYDLKSYDIFLKINYKRGIAYSLTNLGEAYNANKEYNKGLFYYELLKDIETEIEDPPGIAFALLQIGQTNFYLKNYNEAFEYYQQALSLSEGISNNTFKSKCLNSIANIYLVRNDIDKALELTNEAIALNIESNYIPGIIKNKIEIALLLSKTKQIEAGLALIDEAIELSNKLGFHAFILKAYQAKAEFYSNLNNNELTILNYKKYLSVYDSLYSLRSFETLNELQKSLQSQLTIERISQDLENQKKERLYMYVIISLLLILGAIIYWRFKTTSKLNKQLIETNNTKDKLFSIVAHDLKSPFNTILGFSELLNEVLVKNEQEKAIAYSEILIKTSTETYNLINNLLDWSRTQQELLILNKVSINITDLITEIIKFKTPQAKVKNINFDISKLNSQNVFADRNCMYIVFSNLISNAIKFTPDNGQISVATKIHNSNIEIDVIDNGIGIKEIDLKNLFNIPKSKSTPGTNNESGTGLGLIICKEFIEKNGGSIRVYSEFGKGSTFKVTLSTI